MSHVPKLRDVDFKYEAQYRVDGLKILIEHFSTKPKMQQQVVLWKRFLERLEGEDPWGSELLTAADEPSAS